MPLHYYLTENRVTVDDPDDYIARPTNQVVHSREDVIKDMTRAGSILKETECRAVLESFFNTVYSYFENGDSYRDDDLAVYHNLSGIYNGPNDRFDLPATAWYMAAPWAGAF